MGGVKSLLQLALCCCALALGWLLITSTDALALSNYTWSGGSSTSVAWSVGGNWDAGTSPIAGKEVGTLTFPRLTSEGCEEEEDACYESFDNLPGVSAEALVLDDGDDYEIEGEELTVGKGGLTATPAAASSGEAGDVLELPIHLGAPQTWHIAGHSVGELGENGLLLAENVTGATDDALTVKLEHKPVLYLFENSTDVGPVTFEGPETGSGAINGVVSLVDGELNFSFGQQVRLNHVLFEGSGLLGPLITTDADLVVGTPVESLEVTSAKLDEGSELAFNVAREGSSAGSDYSQLESRGEIELANSQIDVFVRKPSESGSCPTLVPGQMYTFVSTTGSLTGAFRNAPVGGPEIPVRFGPGCPQKSQTMRIAYHETGSPQTVTGVVEEAAVKAQEQAALAKRQEEERILAAQKKKQEEELAALVRREEEQSHAGAGVLGATEATVSSAEIEALLRQALVPSGKAAKAASLLKAGGYTLTFKAPERGAVILSWYLVLHGAKLATAKPTLVATAKLTFSAAGSKKIKLELTTAGKRLLKSHGSTKLTGLGSFTPTGKSAVTVTKGFVLEH